MHLFWEPKIASYSFDQFIQSFGKQEKIQCKIENSILEKILAQEKFYSGFTTIRLDELIGSIRGGIQSFISVTKHLRKGLLIHNRACLSNYLIPSQVQDRSYTVYKH